MKITKKQLRKFINEYHPRPDDDYDPLDLDAIPLNPDDDDAIEFDRGYYAGFAGRRATSTDAGYLAGYEEGVFDAKDPDSEASREDEEGFGPRREGRVRFTKRQLRRIIKEAIEDEAVTSEDDMSEDEIQEK